MPSALDLLLSQLRRDLEREESPLRSQVILAYESAIYDLEHDLFNVTWLIEDAQSRGIEITPDWLYRQDRYKRLIAKAEEQMARFSQQALPIIEQTNMRGASLGGRHATPLLEAAGIQASFGTGINTPAVETLMQTMFRPGPIRDVLDSYGGNVTAVIRHHMGQGVIQGLSPREVVRNITRDLASGTNQARLSTLVRTEHMRAYRLSQGQHLEQVAHAIMDYQWNAALQPGRTCLACLSLHGTVSSERRGKNHPNCRCIETPRGYFTPERYRNTTTGADWFAAQPAAIQRKMMPSQAAFDAYKRGDVQMSDFLGEKHSDTWGTSVYERSGKEAIAVAERRRG